MKRFSTYIAQWAKGPEKPTFNNVSIYNTIDDTDHGCTENGHAFKLYQLFFHQARHFPAGGAQTWLMSKLQHCCCQTSFLQVSKSLDPKSQGSRYRLESGAKFLGPF